MQTTTTRTPECNASGGTLYVALELGAREWRLAYSTGLGDRVRQTVIRAGAVAAVRAVLERAKRQCGLAEAAPVRSCYEAGRDGFWPHRLLAGVGVVNTVVDSSSIEVDRRARRAKTDRLDAAKLLRLLQRVGIGEQGVWHAVAVPTPAAEAARHGPRALTMLIGERTRWRNRLHGVLATVGVRLRLDGDFVARLATARTWAGEPIDPALQARVLLGWRQLQAVEQELRAWRRAQRMATRAAATPAAVTAQRLAGLRAVGERWAWVVATEVCHRDLRNRRQVGALTGFTSVPHQSGQRRRDQGISRAGVAAVRRLAVEAAWVWLQWQPQSALSQWYQRRFAHGGPRARQIGIVALARRLVIALWRYARDGVVPAGARLKAGAR